MASELIVVKHGSSVVENTDGIGIDQTKINFHAWQHVFLRATGLSTVEVASGAVVEGKEKLLRDFDMPIDGYDESALAQFGTARQIAHWEEACRPHGIPVGQVLATHQEINDTSEGKRLIENIRKVTSHGALVVINENDAAAVDEMLVYEAEQAAKQRGDTVAEADNDWLAAHLAMSIGASTLLLLGNMDGFQIDGKVVPEIRVAEIDGLLRHCDGSSNSGRGGMASKLQAAGKAAEAGLKVIIGNAFSNTGHLMAGDGATKVLQ